MIRPLCKQHFVSSLQPSGASALSSKNTTEPTLILKSFQVATTEVTAGIFYIKENYWVV